MPFFAPQTTLAFAHRPEDLDDVDFTAPVIMSTPAKRDDRESEPGEP
jgi:hypothetical protein